MRSLSKWVVIVAGLCVLSVSAALGAEYEAITTARHDLKLGLTVPGKVKTLHVKPGQVVSEGQLLLELENEEGLALVEVYKLRAASDLEVRAQEAQADLAVVEEKAITQAFEKAAASQIEVERAQIKTVVEKLKVDMAKQSQEETILQLKQAQARSDQYFLKAPVAGVIDTVLVANGETVESLKPVIRLVQADPIWIDVNVPTHATMSLRAEQSAWVTYTMTGQSEPVLGKIIHLAPAADAASDTRVVRVEVPNPNHLPSGLHVMVSFTAPLVDGASSSPELPMVEGGR